MRSRVVFLTVVVGLVVASCGGGESTETTPADELTTSSTPTTAETAPFHAIPADSVVVTGTATCEFSQEGVDPTGGDNNDLATCELDMSDPRVSGTETHDRFRYHIEDETGWVWVAEEAVITNDGGTWRGSAQAADDVSPIGEAHYVGEGAYDGLEFHYYFAALRNAGDSAQVRGWISSSE